MTLGDTHSLWRVLRRVFLLAALALTAASCEPVFEEPDECGCEPRKRFDIKLHFNTSFADTQTSFFRGEDEENAESLDAGVLMRCTVYAYLDDDSSRATSRVEDAPDEQFSFTIPDGDTGDRELDISLPSGTWSLMVWVDYYRDDEQFEYYNITDFSEIALNEERGHRGCDDYRDAFRGIGEVTIDAYSEEPAESVVIDMDRPLAKFEFISNDLSEFTESILSSQKAPAESPTQAADAAQSPEKIPINLDEFTVRFYYQGFMPSAFNMFADQPSDAMTGVWFDGKITRLSDSEAEIGFDYVFVNHRQTNVSVAVAVYDATGECISVTSPYEVPLTRNYLTIVKGQFLTSKTGNGAKIDPGFAGDYNYFVH